MKDVGTALRKIVDPSILHVNLDKHSIPPGHLKLGKKIKATIHGKITSVHQDQFGKRAVIDIHKIDHHENSDGID